MQFDMEVENSNNDGSEQASTSDDGQFLVALRKMMKKEVEVVVIRTVQQVIVPMFEGMVRTAVKQEIQSVEKRLLARNANEVTVSKERRLQLKLSEEVSDPVRTGTPLTGKGGNSLKVELVDRETGRVVENGPISSAEVEILVLDASHDDSEHNWTLENFNNRIIREGDKKRPHFSKNIYISLKEGVGVLSNVKLGHDSRWMKSYKCRLGARIVESFRGVNVQEGRTGSFMVVDRRSKQYEKHYPPSLSDKVWRLDNIGRDGDPCKRLFKENVETVGDFLFLLSLDPHRLQKLVGAGAKWNATVDHARTCTKDDKVYLHYPSANCESKMGVIFDAVGGLKGIINDSHYVPIGDLSADEKDSTRELLVSAFKNREARTCFDDEASVLKQFPYRSSTELADSPTNSAGSNGNCVSAEAGMSSQGNDAYVRTLDCAYNNDHFGTGVSIPFPSCPFPDPGTSSQCTGNMLHSGSLGSPLHESSSHANVESPSYYFNFESWSLRASHQAKVKVWVLRARKRVMTLECIHAHKKQKT